MIRIITDYLDASVKKAPDKCAFVDENHSFTFKELQRESYCVAQGLINKGKRKKPIAIFLDKCIECIACCMGIAYSGNFYTILDTEMPSERIKKIIDVLHPELIITDGRHMKQLEAIVDPYAIEQYKDFKENTFCFGQIQKSAERILSSDILHVMFTSGSTGNPKGVVSSHRAMIDAAEARTKAMGYSEEDVFANQFPFFFIGSASDIFATIKNGATDYIIPKRLFFSPEELVEFLSEKSITVLDWIAPMLVLLAKYDVLGTADLTKIRTVIFGGELLPMKILDKWRKALPQATFINAYGATEFTGACLYYKVEGTFGKAERLPLGIPLENTEVFILSEKDEAVEIGEIGELCIRSTTLADGYYKDEKKTKEVFIQNPLNHVCPDIIYRTHDLVLKNENGELIHMGRKDFQVKRRGYRIELGEIEACAASFDGVDESCCLFDDKKQKLILVYGGNLNEDDLSERIKDLLPGYMLPDRIRRMDALPRTQNGKIDRVRLKELYEKYSCTIH